MSVPDDTTAPVIICPTLRAAYEATLYEVETPSGLITLKVGQPTESSWHTRVGGAQRIAVISAFNPFSRELPADENLARHLRLQQAVAAGGHRAYPAVGRDPTGEWAAETSLAVLDPTDRELDDWMLAFGQNAVVVADKGRLVDLRVHPREIGRMARDAEARLRGTAHPASTVLQSTHSNFRSPS